MCCCTCLLNIISLKFLTELACFICICIICSLSRKNPFETHSIGDLDLYFNDVVNTSSITTLIQNNIIYNNSINNSLIKKLSQNGYKYISSEKILNRKTLLRQLVSTSFCLDIRDDFEKFKGSKLSTIFDLNYSKIKNISIANLATTCGLFVTMIPFVYFLFLTKNNDYDDTTCCGGCFIGFVVFSGCLSSLSYIARFILSIILFYFIEKSDIEKFDDFLKCENVNKKNFEEFSDITKLKNCCFAFLILNIIVQGIDKIEKCSDFFENKEQKRKVKYLQMEIEALKKQNEINKEVSTTKII